jgi:hypothetical protein
MPGSLINCFQQTFGLSPIEAMSAALPSVVISDWDGYRNGVRDGVDGFGIPTLAFAPWRGGDLADRYDVGVDDFDYYSRLTSQFVAVDVELVAATYRKLISDPDRKSFALSRLTASSRMKEQPMSDEKTMGQVIQIDEARIREQRDPCSGKWMNLEDPAQVLPILLASARWCGSPKLVFCDFELRAAQSAIASRAIADDNVRASHGNHFLLLDAADGAFF